MFQRYSESHWRSPLRQELAQVVEIACAWSLIRLVPQRLPQRRRSVIYFLLPSRGARHAGAIRTRKQFSYNKIKLREPPELDFAPEQPKTVAELIDLHMADLGLSVGELATMLRMNEDEIVQTYGIRLPGQPPTKSNHLRIVR
jgi:hypothetical protein